MATVQYKLKCVRGYRASQFQAASTLFAPLLLIVQLISAPAPAAAQPYDPTVPWFTIETEHFRIHYLKPLEPIGKRAAGLVEPIYTTITGKLGWEPPGKTELVFRDHTDAVNAFAIPTPYRMIVFETTLPEEGSDLDSYDDWLRTLIMHEFTHTVHIGSVRGVWSILRSLFGTAALPNGFFPQWTTEGLAMWFETAETTGGRGRSPVVEMVLRADALEDRFLPIADATYYKREYPHGLAAYWYGIGFHKFLVDRYGFEKISEFNRLNSGSFPYFFNFKTRKIFGKSFYRLWKEWEEKTKAGAKELVARIESEGAIEGVRLTEAYGLNRSLNWSPDGQAIWVGSGGGKLGTGTYEIPVPTEPNGEPAKSGKRIYAFASRSLSEPFSDGSRLYSQVNDDSYPYYTAYNDLYRVSSGERRGKPITRQARLLNVICDPRNPGSALAVQIQSNYRMRIVSVDSTGAVRPLWTPPDPGQVGALSTDRSGEQIAFSYFPTGRARDIYLLNRRTQLLTRITQDSATDTFPDLSPDGTTIAFVSDRTGVPNLFGYHLPSRTFHQLTNSVTGVTRPKFSPDGARLAFFRYYSKGYDLHLLPIDLKSAEAVNDLFVPEPPATAPSPSGDAPDPKPYSAATDKLLPHFLLPVVLLTERSLAIGALTGSFDPLLRHQWQAFGLYDTTFNTGRGSAAYVYRKIGLFGYTSPRRLGTMAVRNPDLASDEDADPNLALLDYDERLSGAGLSFGPFRFPFTGKQFGISFSAQYEYRSRLSDFTGALEEEFPVEYPKTGHYPSLRAALVYGKTLTLAYPSFEGEAVVPWTFGLGVELFNRKWGARYTQTILSGDTKLRLPIPYLKSHRLALKLAGGAMFGESTPTRTFFLGGNFGDFFLTNTGARYYFMRGFPVATFRGDGIIVLNAEHRIPLFFLDWGPGTFPVYLRGLSWSFFADLGHTFELRERLPVKIKTARGLVATNRRDSFDLSEPNLSFGAELRLDTNIGFLPLPIQGRLGYAHQGLVEGDSVISEKEYDVYVLLGTSF